MAEEIDQSDENWMTSAELKDAVATKDGDDEAREYEKLSLPERKAFIMKIINESQAVDVGLLECYSSMCEEDEQKSDRSMICTIVCSVVMEEKIAPACII